MERETSRSWTSWRHLCMPILLPQRPTGMSDDALRLCVKTPGRKVEQLFSSWGYWGKRESMTVAKAQHRIRAKWVSKFPRAVLCEASRASYALLVAPFVFFTLSAHCALRTVFVLTPSFQLKVFREKNSTKYLKFNTKKACSRLPWCYADLSPLWWLLSERLLAPSPTRMQARGSRFPALPYVNAYVPGGVRLARYSALPLGHHPRRTFCAFEISPAPLLYSHSARIAIAFAVARSL